MSFWVASGGPLRPQAIDVDRELEEAKSLYREAKFATLEAEPGGDA